MTNANVNVPTKIIDLELLRNRYSGRTSTVVAILSAFVDESRGCLHELKRLEVQQDTVLVGKVLHGMQGLLRTVGAIASAEELLAIERRLADPTYLLSGDLVRIEQTLSEVWAAADRVREELV